MRHLFKQLCAMLAPHAMLTCFARTRSQVNAVPSSEYNLVLHFARRRWNRKNLFDLRILQVCSGQCYTLLKNIDSKNTIQLCSNCGVKQLNSCSTWANDDDSAFYNKSCSLSNSIPFRIENDRIEIATRGHDLGLPPPQTLLLTNCLSECHQLVLVVLSSFTLMLHNDNVKHKDIA